MTDMQIWHFASGRAQSVAQEDQGTFSSDQAYVVLTQAADGQKLYLWAGSDAAKGTLATAAKHASELKETMNASYLRQQQGQEAPEFKQLFEHFVVKPTEAVKAETEPAAAPEVEDALPAEAVAADGEVGAEDEAEGEAEEAQAGAAATGKKKKKKNKKKGTAAAAIEAAPTAVAATVSPEDAAPATDAPDAAAGAASAVALAPSESAGAGAEESKLSSPPPVEKPASPQPAGDKPLSPTPAEQSPTPEEAAAATPAPHEKVPAPAPEAFEAATPAPDAKPAPAPTAAVPKGEVEEVGVESVSKAKEQLLSRLGSGAADSLTQKQVKKTGTPRSTYLADSAKAWGGVAAAPPPTAEAKIKPGEQTFGVEELKAMRAEAGIDMTCKEAYLSDAEFEKVFGKDRATFKAMPAWRQQIAKKQVGLW